MTSEKILMTWIDDEKRNILDANDLMKLNNNLIINFIHPLSFEKLKKKQKVDIFLLDYKLNQKIHQKERYKGDAIYLRGLIKSKYPDIPIYVYSQDERALLLSKLAYVSDKEMDFKISYQRIQDEGKDIFYYDGLDYKKIRNKMINGLNKLIDLLHPPEEERNKIRGLLPHVLKTKKYRNVNTETLAGKSLEYAKWVRNIFMKNPGFVYNSKFSAILLGMTHTAFTNRINAFKPALYDGIFSNTNREKLWWKIRLYDILSQKASERHANLSLTTNFLKELSIDVFKLQKDEIAKCVVCDEKYPDAIGSRLDEDEREPVHLGCSCENPNDEMMLYFDEIRLIES